MRMHMNSKNCFILALLLLAAFISSGCNDEDLITTKGGTPGIIEILGVNPTPVSNTFYGLNYWWWNSNGNYIKGTEDQVQALHLNVLRSGGYNNDAQVQCITNKFEPFTKAETDRFITYCRSVGVEPILQVSLLKNVHGQKATAQDAADWVAYCNIIKKYNVRYWEIGNEPDLYAGKDLDSYDVTKFCNDFNDFSRAMKAVDPTIKILGPELSWRYYPQTGDEDWMKTLNHTVKIYGLGFLMKLAGKNLNSDWLTPFLQNCRGNFDIVAIHRYPFPANKCIISNAFNDGVYFRSLVRHIRSLMKDQDLGDTPLAVTEANITALWGPDVLSASTKTYGAGLWLADSLGVALEENIWTIAYWCICDDGTFGFLDPRTKKPRPTGYVLQMYSTLFGSSIIHPISVPGGFSVYASRNTDNNCTILMVINKNKVITHEIIKFSEYKTNLTDREYDFPGYSLTCLKIPDDGRPMQIWSYTEKLADKGLPPEQIQ